MSHTASDEPLRTVATRLAAAITLAQALEVLSSNLARMLSTPVAVLSRDSLGWRFETHAYPDSALDKPVLGFEPSERSSDPAQGLRGSADAWTAITLGTFAGRDWAFVVPGQSADWANRSGLDKVVEHLGWSLQQVTNREQADYSRRFQRTLHAFSRRLARVPDRDRLNSLILRTVASHVRARTGALALFVDEDHALAIVATLGYPLPIVEHLRIAPGEGLLGRAYQTSKPIVGSATSDGRRRLRYRTDSYMVLPLLAGAEPVGAIALTDKADGRHFDVRDVTTTRLLVSSAATALSREHLRAQLAHLTQVATIDPVTGLFNRRYVEKRLGAEVERARRQNDSLALLLIDIDDFKRVNDTRGHLEGDRTLRDVADLLKAGVRIFDVCARYGGEEFVIVMPGASLDVAQHVAERIRVGIERSFSQDSPPVTVSVGVAVLREGSSLDSLVDIADRALIAAKKAGKNLVCTASQ